MSRSQAIDTWGGRVMADVAVTAGTPFNLGVRPDAGNSLSSLALGGTGSLYLIDDSLPRAKKVARVYGFTGLNNYTLQNCLTTYTGTLTAGLRVESAFGYAELLEIRNELDSIAADIVTLYSLGGTSSIVTFATKAAGDSITSSEVKGNTYIIGNTSAGIASVPLPAIAADLHQRSIIVKREGANLFTIVPTGADTIDGGVSKIFNNDLEAYSFTADNVGKNWRVS